MKNVNQNNIEFDMRVESQFMNGNRYRLYDGEFDNNDDAVKIHYESKLTPKSPQIRQILYR